MRSIAASSPLLSASTPLVPLLLLTLLLLVPFILYFLNLFIIIFCYFLIFFNGSANVVLSARTFTDISMLDFREQNWGETTISECRRQSQALVKEHMVISFIDIPLFVFVLLLILSICRTLSVLIR